MYVFWILLPTADRKRSVSWLNHSLNPSFHSFSAPFALTRSEIHLINERTQDDITLTFDLFGKTNAQVCQKQGFCESTPLTLVFLS